MGTWKDWKRVPEGAFVEVAPSKLAMAEDLLAGAPFLLLPQENVRQFSPDPLACRAPARPYLLRAYRSSGDGVFSLHWSGASLVVAYDSMGGSGVPARSALVACLARDPRVVFSALGGVE